jgi:hypothetical protein
MAAEGTAAGAAAGTVFHCPVCKSPVGETCELNGRPALRLGGGILRGKIRVYCVVCRQPRHYKPKGAVRES